LWYAALSGVATAPSELAAIRGALLPRALSKKLGVPGHARTIKESTRWLTWT
jgi:hypothetical protein